MKENSDKTQPDKAQDHEQPYWDGKHYSFFQNKECEYFPCHKTNDPSQFNCLFCYCPLYALGRRCGGNFRYTKKGIKDCTPCMIPHVRKNYGLIVEKYSEICNVIKRADSEIFPEKIVDGTVGKSPEQGRNDASEKQIKQEAVLTAQKLSEQEAGLTAQKLSEQEAGLTTQKLSNQEAELTAQKLSGQETELIAEKEGTAPAEPQIVMMACTERGFATMRRASYALSAQMPEVKIIQTGHCKYVPGFENTPRLSELTEKWFARADALVFFTATGIAVRCIAPFVEDKFSDPAVIVLDESGKYCISLLSGHAGGANRLCRLLSASLGAEPVITTATDGREQFAVDVFSSENGLILTDRVLAKDISARILSGKAVRIFIEEALLPDLPDPARYGGSVYRTEDRCEADIIVSVKKAPGDRADALYLVPSAVTLGIGCRRGADAGQIREAVEKLLEETGVFRESLKGIASIDLKKEETGLHAFAGNWNLPLTFFSAEELNSLPGVFTSSEFVHRTTGTDNVCERSAVLLAGQDGRLLAGKTAGKGATAALAMGRHRIPGTVSE